MAPTNGATLVFQNVRIFDGVSRELSPPSNVRIDRNKIAKISTTAIPHSASAQVIAGGGRTLIPGLIDAHWHALMCALPVPELVSADVGYIHIVAGREAERTLLRGFTTVRDCGGPAFALKRAIDEGKILGPRIYPSGAMISQSAGHGDFRFRYDVPRQCLCRSEVLGATAIADGVPAVLQATREQLLLGATQIKLMAGGGVASLYDPIDVSQYTDEEFRAAVHAADDWGTYVTVHAYTVKSMRRAVAAGVKCVEHGHLIDADTARLFADQGIWLSMQPFLDDEDAVQAPSEAQRQKQLLVIEGTDTAYRLARKHHVKLAWGSDTLFSAALAERQGRQLVKLSRWFESHEVLRMATGDNGSLLAMCGERNPYPGALGLVREGALADLLLVDGNPLEKLDLLADPEKNLLAIVKDGVVYKNLLR